MVTIKVKPHHLRGNSYTHKLNDTQRMCPLQEALIEMGYPNAEVGGTYVYLDQFEPNTWHRLHHNEWNSGIVTDLIKEAEAGSEKEVQVNIYLRTEIQNHEILC